MNGIISSLSTLKQLVAPTSSGEERSFDAMGLSSVDDPVQVQNNWKEALFLNHLARKVTSMDKIVMLIDSSTFGTEWVSLDSSSDMERWADPNNEHSAENSVPVILSDEIEAIDNVDLMGEGQG